jgi:hypothetical protein
MKIRFSLRFSDNIHHPSFMKAMLLPFCALFSQLEFWDGAGSVLWNTVLDRFSVGLPTHVCRKGPGVDENNGQGERLAKSGPNFSS